MVKMSDLFCFLVLNISSEEITKWIEYNFTYDDIIKWKKHDFLMKKPMSG